MTVAGACFPTAPAHVDLEFGAFLSLRLPDLLAHAKRGGHIRHTLMLSHTAGIANDFVLFRIPQEATLCAKWTGWYKMERN